jgi:hypothetical protein
MEMLGDLKQVKLCRSILSNAVWGYLRFVHFMSVDSRPLIPLCFGFIVHTSTV